MTRVIQNPKDAIDESIEVIGAVKGMIGCETPQAIRATKYLQEAVANLQSARTALLHARK